MQYQKQITLKSGKTCILRNGTKEDAKAVYEIFQKTHEETDFLLSYPEETTMTVEGEGEFLQEKTNAPREVEILAIVDGQVVATAGIHALGSKYKVKHRADFGISVLQAYWNEGIGKALTESCIACAKEAGYTQLELDVVAENDRALALYRSLGFIEYGRNPKGFFSKLSGYQELVAMRLELQG